MSIIDLPESEAAHAAEQSQVNSLRVSMCFEMYMNMCANNVDALDEKGVTTCKKYTKLALLAVDTFVEEIS